VADLTRGAQEAHPDDAKLAESRRQALSLRIAGASYRKIAETMGISVAWAHELVTNALREVQEAGRELADGVRDLERERLDALLLSLWTKRENPRVADTILRVMERRARLDGLDVPSTTRFEGPDGGPIPIDLTDGRQLLLDRLAAIAARQAPPQEPSAPPATGG
jgi:hypothetical protein